MMSRKKYGKNYDAHYFRQQMKPRKNAMLQRDPEIAVESHLIRLEKLDKEYFSFWEDYWTFLSREREKLIDDIKDSIFNSKSGQLELTNLSRIVEGAYGHDPLCSYGSIKSSGGRFNFGQISSSLMSFQALYLAENYNTAFCEKYIYRNDEVLANTEEKLLSNIFESNYKQWGVWLDQPSNSQWVGHYAKLAGLQAIVYPSCRNTSGYNLALFTDIFENSDATVEIAGEASFIDPTRKKIDSSNYQFYFKSMSPPKFTSQITQ